MDVTLDNAIALIEAKRKAEAERHIKTFEEDTEMEVLNGRFGPYIAYKGKNYKIPKNMADKAKELTYDECKAIIAAEADKPARPSRRRRKA